MIISFCIRYTRKVDGFQGQNDEDNIETGALAYTMLAHFTRNFSIEAINFDMIKKELSRSYVRQLRRSPDGGIRRSKKATPKASVDRCNGRRVPGRGYA